MGIKVDSFLSNSGINAEKNTWERRSNTVPSIVKNENYLTLRTDTEDVHISSFEECVLQVIAGFTFCPAWLVEQWLGEKHVVGDKTEKEVIISWIRSGIVWIQNSVTGEYLRPTNLLFRLFGKPEPKFTDIPYNQLTHTVSEQEVCFSVMSGRPSSPLVKNFEGVFMPKYSPLGIQGDTGRGTNIIREAEFRSMSVFMKKSIPEIEDIESRIKGMIERGESVTPEFEDFKNFIIIKKQDNTGVLKQDYRFHIPDLIIPILRTEGRANSISIEIELSDKKLNRYIDTLQKYRDNNRFGHLVWLTQSESINRSLRQAYKEVGGLGHTQMHIYEFSVPSPSSVYKIK